MRRLRAGLLAVAIALWPSGLSGQRLLELGARATLATSPPTALVGGPEAAIRVGRRDRLALGVGLGAAAGALAGRGELLWHFLLSPEKEGRPGFYGGAGLAVAADSAWRGLVVATVGVDWNPGGRSGWMAELGIGGGLRVALGYRWRRHGSGK